MRRTHTMTLARAACLCWAASTAHAQWTVSYLPTPDGFVNGIGGGWVAGARWVGGPTGTQPVLWSVDLHTTVDLGGDGYVRQTDGVQHVGQRLPTDSALWTGTSGAYVDLRANTVDTWHVYDVDAGVQVGTRGTSAGSFAHAWTGTAASAVSLHPTGAHNSWANAVHAGTIGGVFSEATFGPWHACVWTNLSPASVIDLGPPGLLVSRVEGLDGLANQVGWTRTGSMANEHAALWHGTAASWVDLHPIGLIASMAVGVSGPLQVGQVKVTTGGVLHAAAWTGSAASFVDLHAFLPASALSSYAKGAWTDSNGTTYVAGRVDTNPVVWRSTNSSDVFCSGDGSGTPCPCGNTGGAGNGCRNSTFAQGAHLAWTGTPSVTADAFVLLGTAMPNQMTVYFQGTQQVNGGAGLVFGDGLRCAGGLVRRLGMRRNVLHGSRYPDAGDVPVSTAGQVPAGGATRTYQVWYRDTSGPCGTGSNVSNGIRVTWTP